jgi:hypothetical protein
VFGHSPDAGGGGGSLRQPLMITGLIFVMVQWAVLVPAAVPMESTTWAVKLNVPTAVGVPLRSPAAFKEDPGGRLPEVIENV